MNEEKVWGTFEDGIVSMPVDQLKELCQMFYDGGIAIKVAQAKKRAGDHTAAAHNFPCLWEEVEHLTTA